MGYIVLSRNPSNRKLLAIVDGDDESIAEFETEDGARDAADGTPMCRAWGFDVVESPL